MKTTGSCSNRDRASAIRPRLAVVGIDYKTSSLQEREPLQLAADDVLRVNDLLVSTPGVMEAVTVCTCNRIEFYLVLREKVEAYTAVAAMYEKYRGLDLAPLREKFFERTEVHAVRHILRLAAGLNSMVLGETQIFGQVKAAYSVACSVKSAGKILHRLFHQAFRAGKKVREDTAIGRGAVSVGSVAARLARDRLSDRPDPQILFVGVNDMIALAAEHFREAGYRRFSFCNRTREHAERLAGNFGGTVHLLNELPRMVGAADLIVACTGSSVPLITCEIVHEAFGGRPDRNVVVLDLGVPRDVEPAVGGLSGVTLLDLDAIHRELSIGLEGRASAIGPAEDIIEDKVDQFVYWYDAVRREPQYNELGRKFEEIPTEELGLALDDCPPEFRGKIEQFSLRLARRLLQSTCRRAE